MSIFTSFGRNISKWGTQEQQEDAEKLKIRVLNKVLVFSIPIIFISLGILYFSLGLSRRYMVGGLGVGFTYVYALYSSYHGRHQTARHLVVISGLVLVFYFRFFTSGNFVDQFLPLIPVTGFVYFLFERKVIKLYNTIAYLIIAGALGKYFYERTGEIDMNYLVAIILFTLCFSMLLALLTVFKKASNFYINRIKEKQKLIDEAQALASIGSWSYNIEKEELSWSDQLFKILNHKLTNKEIALKDLEEILPLEHKERLKKAADEKQEDFYLDIDYKYLNGEGSKWLRFIGEHHKEANRSNGKLLGVVQDITERKKYEEQVRNLLMEVQLKNQQLEQQSKTLRKTNFDLKRSNQELEQFAYVASHDLQEPLRMVGNFVQLLEEEYTDKIDKEGKSYINFAVSGVTRMNQLIEDLLQYSRVGRKGAKMSEVNVEKMVHNKLLDLKKKIEEKEATIVIGDLPKQLFCEKTQIGIIFYNLILNALKFNKNRPKIEISAEEGIGDWVFSVKDNGIGINPKNKDKVFEIFKRLHRKEEYAGTGIGLALCKRIILRHHGDIWYESELGHGTTFFFSIPKGLEEAEE